MPNIYSTLNHKNMINKFTYKKSKSSYLVHHKQIKIQTKVNVIVDGHSVQSAFKNQEKKKNQLNRKKRETILYIIQGRNMNM